MSFGGYETNNGNPNKQVRCWYSVTIKIPANVLHVFL